MLPGHCQSHCKSNAKMPPEQCQSFGIALALLLQCFGAVLALHSHCFSIALAMLWHRFVAAFAFPLHFALWLLLNNAKLHAFLDAVFVRFRTLLYVFYVFVHFRTSSLVFLDDCCTFSYVFVHFLYDFLTCSYVSV